jgi:amino acid transporter
MGRDDEKSTPPVEASENGVEPKSVDRSVSGSEGEVNLSQGHQLQRGLKSRHIQFLALGGA